MKRILFYILFLALACIAKAQEDYQPFVVEGKTWIVPITIPGMFAYMADATCTMRGDTVISNQTYKKVYTDYLNGFADAVAIHSHTEKNGGYLCAIRESGKKVYLIPREKTESYLMYDFTLEKGNVFKGKTSHVHCSYNGKQFDLGTSMKEDVADDTSEYTEYTIVGVDTIEVSGYKRRRIKLSYNNSEQSWIEGIGCAQGMFDPLSVNAPEMTLYRSSNVSCYENGKRIYGIDDFKRLQMGGSSDATVHMLPYDFEESGIYYKKTSETEVAVACKDMYESTYTGSIHIPQQVVNEGKRYDVTSVGDYAFYYSLSLDEVNLPVSIQSIGCKSFAYCRSLKSLSIPENVSQIGVQCFEGCEELSKIVVSDLKKWCRIGYYQTKDTSFPQVSYTLYQGNTTIEDLAIPEGWTDIEDGSFAYCSSLSSVTVPGSVERIGDYSFYSSGLKRVVLNAGVLKLGDYAFSGCSHLESVVVSKDLQEIGMNAFANCPIKSIEIPESLKRIANYALQGTKIVSIELPAGIEYGNSVFYNCNELTEIRMHDMVPPSIKCMGFSNSTYDQATLYVPAGSAEKYRAAEGWSKFESIVEMEATGISQVPTAGSNNEERLYDLQGRRLKAAPQRGMYIRNGRKYVVK